MVRDTCELLSETSNLPPVPIMVREGETSTYLELRFGRCGKDETLVLILDVTEQRKAELSLQQSQKLESLGVLAGGVAHDFNNLLTSILGHAQLARDTVSSCEETRQFLSVIENSAQRAAKLTGNLLAYAGEAHIELKTFNLTDLIQEMKPLWSTTLAGGTELKVEAGNEPRWIHGNETQISQIIMNLVRNGVESIASGPGEIVLTIAPRRLEGKRLPNQVLQQAPRPGNYIRLSVRDNGCGLSPAVQQRIFDPFYTSKGAGRGLGLAAVLGIVSHHSGVLTLTSREGEGTHFNVYIPAAEAPSREGFAATGQGLPLAVGHALVVDDDVDVRDFVCRFLGRLGLKTTTAGDGEEAVRVLMADRPLPSLIFMDYAMPGMDGVRALGLIREKFPELPVVMMSGFGEGEILGNIDRNEHTLFLSKPFELDSLKKIVQSILKSRAGEAEA
jgi:signal transduction histidine kinase/CheY-like chemotaxis protein